MRWILLALLATPATADCPAVPDRSGDLAALFTAANAADTQREGRVLGAAMWRVWADAPDDAAQTLLEDGMARRAVGDRSGAAEAFDALIAYCPAYAEGYNQRAFLAYLGGSYEDALTDLDAALARQPLHVPALSGRALTLLALDRRVEAARDFERALTLNPWIPERDLARAVIEDSDTF